MNNLFGIGILFELKDRIGNRLRGISRDLDEVETQAEQTTNSINSLQNVLQEGSSFQLTQRESQRLTSILEGTSRESERLQRRMQHMAHYMGGELNASTREAYAVMQTLRAEMRTTSRQYGKYSEEAIDARNRMTEFALALNDTAFKQIYMRGQLGLTTRQLQQQANSIRLNARMVQLMNNPLKIMHQRMEGLQKLGIKPEMMMPPSTIGQFELLNDAMQHNVSKINLLSTGYRNFGYKVEKVIKNYSAQKVAIREANGSMTRYHSLLTSITGGLASLTMAYRGLAIAGGLYYMGLGALAYNQRESLQELVDVIKGKVLKAMEPLIDTIAKVMTVALKTTGAIADWVTQFNKAHPIIAKVLSVVTLLAPALIGLFLPVAFGVGVWKGWMLVINQVWTLFGGVVTLVGTATATFLTLAVVVGSLVTVFLSLWKTNKDFRNAIKTIWKDIKTTITSAIDYVKKSFEKNFAPVFETGKTVLKSFSNVFNSTFAILKEVVNTTFEAIGKVFGVKGKESGDILKNAYDTTIGFVAQRLDTFLTKVKITLDGINRYLTSHKDEIVSTINSFIVPAIKLVEQAWTNANKMISLALQTMGDIVTGVLDNLRVFWNKHGYEVTNTVNQIVSTVQEFSTQIQEFIGVALDIISGWWKEHGSDVMSTVTMMVSTVGNIISSLGEILMTVFGGIVSFMSEHGNTIKTIITVVWTVISTIIMDTLNNILGLIEGVTNVIEGVVKFFSSMMKGDFKGMWEGIKQIFTGALQTIYNGVMLYLNVGLLKSVKGLAKGFKASIKTMWTSVKTLFSDGITKCYVFADDFVKGVVKKVKKMPTDLANVFDNMWNFIKTAFKTGVEWVVNFFKNLVTGIQNAVTSIPTIISNIFSAIGNFITSVKNFFVQLITDLPTMASNLWSFIVNAWNTGIQFCKNLISTFVSNIIGFFTSLWSVAQNLWSFGLNYIRGIVSAFISNVISFFSNFKANITNIFTTVLNTGKTIFTNLVNTIKSVVSKIPDNIKKPIQDAITYLKGISLVQIGKNMMEGLANGIKNTASKIVSAMKDVVQGAIDKAKSLLKINSPSKLFKQFGAWTSEGMAIGITKEAPQVINSMEDMTNETIGVAEASVKQIPEFLVKSGVNQASTKELPNKTENNQNSTSNFTYNITINADNKNLGSDPTAFAKEIFKEVKRLQQLEDSMNYKPTNLVF